MPRCSFCESEISESAKKCRFCGEWVGDPHNPNSPSVPALPNAECHTTPATNIQQPITVNVKQEESVAFAVITLLFYIFLWPVGVLLNLVGLMTGPRHGCFVAMLLVFVVLPVVAFLIALSMGIPLVEIVMQEILSF